MFTTCSTKNTTVVIFVYLDTFLIFFYAGHVNINISAVQAETAKKKKSVSKLKKFISFLNSHN